MKETLAALLVGTLIAAAVSCGAGAKSAKAPAAMPAAEAGSILPGSPKARIKELDDQITAELAKLGVPPPIPASTCPAGQPCPTMQALSVKPKPSDDPTCKPSEAQVCKDQCMLADSICDNAKTICEIAKDLATDAWANDKCTSGNASCDAAHDKCCGCT